MSALSLSLSGAHKRTISSNSFEQCKCSGHKHYTPVLSQPSVPVVQKTPEEIQRGASELIQRLKKEKTEQEELAKKYREMNVFEMDEKERQKGVCTSGTRCLWCQI